MIRGIYTAASGMNLNMQEVDVIAHNLANINTSGYKKREPVAESFGDILVEMAGEEPSKVGTGVHLASIGQDERAGALRPTGNPLDLALQSEGQYFMIQRKNGSRLLTRDGQFYRDPENRLVTASGDAVLDSYQQPLILKGELKNIKFREDGTILGADGENGKIFVVAPTQGELQNFPLVVGRPAEAEGVSLKQGFLEQSNVNVVTEMVALMEANKQFGFEQKIVSAHDQMLQKAANDVGRVQ